MYGSFFKEPYHCVLFIISFLLVFTRYFYNQIFFILYYFFIRPHEVFSFCLKYDQFKLASANHFFIRLNEILIKPRVVCLHLVHRVSDKVRLAISPMIYYFITYDVELINQYPTFRILDFIISSLNF